MELKVNIDELLCGLPRHSTDSVKHGWVDYVLAGWDTVREYILRNELIKRDLVVYNTMVVKLGLLYGGYEFEGIIRAPFEHWTHSKVNYMAVYRYRGSDEWVGLVFEYCGDERYRIGVCGDYRVVWRGVIGRWAERKYKRGGRKIHSVAGFEEMDTVMWYLVLENWEEGMVRIDRDKVGEVLDYETTER